MAPFVRRTFLKLTAAAGAATVVGFNPSTRSWITKALADTSADFQHVPHLDGELLLDEPSRLKIATDYGNLFHRVPAAVLRPRSVQDIVRMVRYANEQSIKVATKGQGHSRYGQTQAEGGIVIDSSTLNAVHAPKESSIDAEPGASWGSVANTALARGLSPRVVTDCLQLTVGGTLSSGGLGNTSQHFGAQVDNVMELDVVTGNGRLITCSPNRESELFNMVLAGLGQCAIIVRARIALMPAPSHVQIDNLIYGDVDAYISDQIQVLKDGRFDHQYGTASRKSDGTWSFTLQVGKFSAASEVPDLAPLENGLRFHSRTLARMTYEQYLSRNMATYAALLVRTGTLPTPAIAMWVPATATKEFTREILALSPKLAGFNFFAFWPISTRRITRPLFKMPSEEQAFSIWLFRSAPGGDDATLSDMLASNRELLSKMTAVGGKRYGPYSMVISTDEWATHFGSDVWSRLSAAKRKFDPNFILAPEPAMFKTANK